MLSSDGQWLAYQSNESGRHEVNVLCQWQSHRSDIERGCAAVLASLRITQ